MAKTTHINKSQIMKRAWEIFKTTPMFSNTIGQVRFGKCLGHAWLEYHSEQNRAFYAAQAIEQVNMTRLDRAKWQFSILQYKSSRINTTAHRKHLKAELERLAA